MTTSALRDIFTYCNNLREVTLINCNHVADDTVRTLARSCTHLDSLNVVDCKNVTIAGMQEVAIHCSNLTKLLLLRMAISDEALVPVQLSLHCRGLTGLCLFHCKDGPLTEAGLVSVLESCTGLTSLTITDDMLESLMPTLDLTKLRQLYSRVQFKCGR